MEDDRGLRKIGLEPLLVMADLDQVAVAPDRVERILQGLTQVALDAVHGTEAASLTLVGPNSVMTTSAPTGPLAEKMDATQYRHGQGPCLEAARSVDWTAIVVRDLQDDARWPAIATDETAAQARSVLSVSLFAAPGSGAGGVQQAVGSLNLYAVPAGFFGASERDTALLLALYAALALAATEALNEAGEQIDQLKEAMATRNVIGQAQGILMERHKVTAGQAFDRLRTASMNLNRKLREVAKDLSDTGQESTTARARRVLSRESHVSGP
jgi:GAF domain-containing protein